MVFQDVIGRVSADHLEFSVRYSIVRVFFKSMNSSIVANMSRRNLLQCNLDVSSTIDTLFSRKQSSRGFRNVNDSLQYTNGCNEVIAFNTWLCQAHGYVYNR